MALSLVSGVAAAERILDPFERLPHDYVLEGPPPGSEIFYATSNFYDGEGEKHNDNVGDALLGALILSAAGRLSML